MTAQSLASAIWKAICLLLARPIFCSTFPFHVSASLQSRPSHSHVAFLQVPVQSSVSSLLYQNSKFFCQLYLSATHLKSPMETRGCHLGVTCIPNFVLIQSCILTTLIF